MGNRRRNVAWDARRRRPEVLAVIDELLSIAAGVLLRVSGVAVEQAIFPNVKGLVLGVAFVIGAYAISTQTDDSL